MDRKSIKSKAKQLMKNRSWELFVPMLLIIIGQLLFSTIFEVSFNPEDNDFFLNFTNTLLQMLIFTPLTIGYLVYILNVVRKKKVELNQIFKPYNNILVIFASTMIASIVIMCGFLLLIIPGIIFALNYAMYQYLLAEGNDDILGVLRDSKDLMKGYRWDYFVFNLSYLGWFLLVPFTLGILLIWLIPYVTIGQTLYYEKLLKNKK